MKKSIRIKPAVVSFLMVVNVLPAFAQDSLSYIDLVKRLYDMEYLTVPPARVKHQAIFPVLTEDRSTTRLLIPM